MGLVTTEAEEQAALARWLDHRRLLWCHPPNGGWRDIRTALALKEQGVKPGVPDVLIFGPPKAGVNVPGAAVELKRGKDGRTSDAQKYWLEQLACRGWLVSVQPGADAAIAWLASLGY